MQKMTELRKKGNDKAMAVLTDSQKSSWNELIGEPFEVKFEPGQGPGGGRPAAGGGTTITTEPRTSSGSVRVPIVFSRCRAVVGSPTTARHRFISTPRGTGALPLPRAFGTGYPGACLPSPGRLLTEDTT